MVPAKECHQENRVNLSICKVNLKKNFNKVLNVAGGGSSKEAIRSRGITCMLGIACNGRDILSNMRGNMEDSTEDSINNLIGSVNRDQTNKGVNDLFLKTGEKDKTEDQGVGPKTLFRMMT